MNTDATRAHIDAETLAAWADHGLSAEAAAAVELHLSNCGRCQEVLAAFVRSTPSAGAVVIPFWTRRPVQWSAAGLAAAAAVVAMIWIGRPPAVRTPESTVASRSVAPEPPPVPAAPPIDQLKEKAAVAPASVPALPAREERRQDKPARALDDKAVANEVAPKKTEGRAAVAPPLPAPLAAPPPPPPPPATMPPPVTVGGIAAATPPAGLGATTITRPAAASEAVVADAFSSIAPTFEIVAPEPSLQSRSVVGAAGGRGGGGAATALSQSAGPARWRVVAGTRIERTVDAGSAWAAVPIEPELKTPLVAGAATSRLNCWLVGRDGVVLVTNDGRTFRRVSVPEAVHLTGVTATDDMRATVTAIDGRKFTTIDGGLTWK